MRKLYRNVALALLGVIGFQGYAQSGLKTANKDYDKMAYIDAISLYEKVAKRGFTDKDLLQNLGNAYYFNAEYAKASPWYEKLFADHGNENIEPEYLYRYAQTLKSIGNTSQAEVYFQKFKQEASSSARANILKDEQMYKDQMKANSGRYGEPTNLAINTPYADYGGSVHNNVFYFTSARDTGNFAKKEHTWTGEAFTSIYQATSNESGNLSAVKRLTGKVRSKFNESTAITTKDGSTMYFTRNNYNGKRGYDLDKSTLLKIYKISKNANGSWSDVQELSINSNEFNTAHPVLSPDEKEMYFVSDRPGGFGEADLWKVALNADGSLGTPVNLGADINTDGRETFPFITSNGELYFATDGRPGFGGLDVFATKIRKDGTFTEVQNVGAPINGPWDDFAYIIDNQTKKGYFSSNRPEGKGNDDIYAFLEDRPLHFECTQQLLLRVVDADTKALITDAQVTMYDNMYTEKERSSTFADNTYVFSQVFECGDTYRFKAEKDAYLPAEVAINFPMESGITERTIELSPKKIVVEKGDDLFKKLKLNPIYFDLDKSFIRKDASIELAKVLEVLQDHPEMTLDIRSHTDSRASHAYNDRLSDRRAKSTADWLISHGIKASRLTYKGYGERQLVNKCADGVKCTEAQHQENRRSEFIITHM